MVAKFWKWGPAGLCLLTLCVFSLIFHYRAPYHDHWDLIPLYDALKDEQLAIRDLFALHGKHWHASGYIVMLGLSPFTHMGHWAECLASVGFAGLGFVALVRMLSDSLDTLSVPRGGAWVIGLSAFFLFSLDQSANWLWGWQVAVFINLAAALWTIERLSVGPITVVKTLIAAACCAISIYAFGTGWVLIPVGFALLIYRGGLKTGNEVACLLVWLLMTGLLIWHLGLAMRATAGMDENTLPDLLRLQTWIGLLHYTFNFMASPIVRFARDSSLVVTAIGFGVLVWAVWRLRPSNPLQNIHGRAPFLALAAYSFGSGLLTALGRWETYGVQHAFVSRYISFGSFFWIAVFVLATLAIAKTHQRRHKGIIAVLGLLFVLKLGNIPSVVQKSVKTTNEITQAVEHLVHAYPDVSPEAYAALQNPVQIIEPHLAVLADHQVSLFATRPAHVSEADADAARPQKEPTP